MIGSYSGTQGMCTGAQRGRQGIQGLCTMAHMGCTGDASENTGGDRKDREFSCGQEFLEPVVSS